MEELIEREKVCRLNGDKEGSCMVLKEMVARAEDSAGLLEIVKLMSRKKGQMKDPLREMIYHAYCKAKEVPSDRIKDNSYRKVSEIDLLNIFVQEDEMEVETERHKDLLGFLLALLRDVIEGKIYLEEERVLVTDAIKQIYLEEGKAGEAAEALYNVHVETFSSLATADILKYQLEQMRLAIKTKDWHKATILSKRVSQRNLDEVEELRPSYLNRLVFMHLGNKNYFEAAKIFDFFRQKEELEPGARREVNYSSMCVFYAILAGLSGEHGKPLREMIKQNTGSKLCIDAIRSLGEAFVSSRVISKRDLVMAMEAEHDRVLGVAVKTHTELLDRRVNEHNLEVVSKYYARVSLGKVSAILGLGVDGVVDLAADLIREGVVRGTIDQMGGVIEFTREKDSLEDWSTGIGKVLDLVIKATHHINKANLAHSLVPQ